MSKTTICLGAILIILGIAAYIWTDGVSITALIPSFFGVPFLVLGLLGLKESRRKHAMHAAAALALIGFLGTASGLAQTVTMLGGGDVERPAAAIVQFLMAALCAIFVGLSIRSFVLARRSQRPS
ncbi:MAG: hypothetical protein FJ217_04435 [Ignavibacteria bacterium]|nr:hypothetical protein [Ignavibacteria bacterium]